MVQLLRILQGHERDVTASAWSPDGNLVVTASADSTARIWDAHTGRELIQLLSHTGGVNTAAWSPDGRLVVTGGSDRTVRIWDAQTGRTTGIAGRS